MFLPVAVLVFLGNSIYIYISCIVLRYLNYAKDQESENEMINNNETYLSKDII